MCWKHDYLELKNLEKGGRRLEDLELLGLLRTFFREEVAPRLETARTTLGRAGYQARVRSTAPWETWGADDAVLLEVREDRRPLHSPVLWFRVMPRVERGAGRADIGVLYSQPFGGEREGAVSLGLTAGDQLQAQLDHFLVHDELKGHA